MFVFIKKNLNRFILSLKNLFQPHKSFPVLLNEKPIVLIMYTLASQVLISLFIMAFLAFIIPTLDEKFGVMLTNIMYGTLAIYPFFIFFGTVAFFHYAKFVGGKGKFLSHFKMMMWAFLYTISTSLLIGIVLSMFSALTGAELPDSLPTYVYGISFFIYSVCAMSSAHGISHIKSFLTHLLMILFCISGYYMFNFFF